MKTKMKMLSHYSEEKYELQHWIEERKEYERNEKMA